MINEKDNNAMNKILNNLGCEGLMPIAVIDDAELAVPTACAIMSGGLNVMEIVIRTEQGLAAIKKVSDSCKDMLLGAGTVLSADKAKEAVDAGAKFIVSPGFNSDVVEWCLSNNVTVVPGSVSPTEIERALSYGVNILKFYPAEVYGGVDGCKALCRPFNTLKFIPTSGVNNDNLTDYADKPFIHAVGGEWLCKPEDIKAKNFDSITKNIKTAIEILIGFHLAHIGINANDDNESMGIAKRFSDIFGFILKEGTSSNFAGDGIEVTNKMGLGSMGHIAIKTNSIKRAAYHLEKRGVCVDWATRKGTEDSPIAVYLKDDIGGFAVHLLQK